MMKQSLLRALCLLLAIAVLAGQFAFAAQDADDAVTILFTHDLHSHFLPVATQEGGESGGYARLSALLTQEREKRAGTAVLTVDAGDFSMGSLFQSIYATDAAELRMLGHLGVDATTFGNHEFDFRPQGLIGMLNSAVSSGDPLPYIVQGNYTTPVPTDDNTAAELTAAFEAYGVRDYVMIEKEGVRFAVFGLLGENADEDSPMSGIAYQDYIAAAKRIVGEIQANEDYDYIVCLSHSGTSEDSDESEDENLARKVDGIDVIISGHTHSTLTSPISVNNTLIVSCGEYAENLGVLRVRKNAEKIELVSYELLAVDETVQEDAAVSAVVEDFKQVVATSYLSNYGMEFDQVLANSAFPFARTGGEQIDKPLGNIITDSYIYAVKQAEGENYESVTCTINAAGVIRDSLSAGDITVSDVFNVLSLGIGADGTPGYPLVSFYLYGKELRDGFEVDASVTSMMPAAQLYGSGVFWKYNTNRMIFNKVTEYGIVHEDGSRAPLEDDTLYRVVTGLYCCQMLSTVKEKSFGILSIAPRNADGSVVTDYDAIILHDQNGNEVKEWYALASYIDSFEKVDGVGVVPDRYESAAANKYVYASWNPIELLKNANIFTWLLLLVEALVILAIVFIIRAIIRRKKKAKSLKK
ncbi:MAG: 5'-nucleotidase C-terminal domain-containing protein [Oscillospiraceae bacterium]|jgi:2',3'-cyclic-nucleotide 2'-phosphodiesterase (5'-nucleotidase family)|nr:5'-nucleotidase C-terminal domain-containing protein [Oscillospiraceae bacterium]